LSLLGTFLTRAGVLISVHAFASDPYRGLFILGLLALFSGGSLMLYAVQARKLEAEGGFKPVSRETFLLANNILLVTAAGVVLFGTLAPLFVEALGLGKISVGPPYFNLMFLLPALPLVALVGVGMHTGWRMMPGDALLRRLRVPAIAAVAVGIVAPFIFFDTASVLTVLSLSIALWVCASSLLDPVRRMVFRTGAPLTRGQVGMCLAHFGVGVFMLGATVASAYNFERDFSARPGDSIEAGGYEFAFNGTRRFEGANFVADEGEFEVRRGGDLVAVLNPQVRVYQVQTQPMTEAAIDSNILRDVFVALGEPLGDNAWSVRLRVKPLIGLLWLGSGLMALGGLVAITDRRYRVAARRTEPATAYAAAEA
jgi:cytochrome c-type biogenesis protein CcmF